MNTECKTNQPLIQAYLDGEVNESQAGPLRQHLLACQDCRNFAQGEKAQKAWFATEAAVAVPDGFAARVARRAFAGDLGEAPAPLPGRQDETPIFQFVLRATAVAAILLLILSVAVRLTDLPSGSRLAADGEVPSREKILNDLDALDKPSSDPAQPQHVAIPPETKVGEER